MKGYTDERHAVKFSLKEVTTCQLARTYDFVTLANGEMRQNVAVRGSDVMYGQAVHNGQTVFVDIELLF
jgi:hypothetical protein